MPCFYGSESGTILCDCCLIEYHAMCEKRKIMLIYALVMNLNYMKKKKLSMC